MTETTTDRMMPSVELASATDGGPRIFPLHGFAILLALAALADWLFYRQAVGLSAALFLLALAVGAVAANRTQTDVVKRLSAAALLVIAVIPILFEPSPLAILFGALATAYFVVTVAGDAGNAWRDRAFNSVALLLGGCWRAIADLAYLRQNRQKSRRHPAGAIAWTTWVVPVALGFVFLMLFASANPLIENWLTVIDWKALFSRLSLARVIFWLIVVSLIWPFVFLHIRSKLRSSVAVEFRALAPEEFLPTLPAGLFGKSVILRSLVLFNLLFAMQTALDIAYLWGGVALPDGMSYASYAHRGAYPLIVTALLAAAFVIVATRPSSDAERSPLVRNLVFLFTAQNVLLVVSSILRLDLYVEVYSLTYWRIAAFIWMGLVAVGLILIVARMALRKSNGWLIGMNLGALALTLYLCGFVSFPRIIADYNVTHSREVSGQGARLDFNYLLSLGPQAAPALDRYFGTLPPGSNVDYFVVRRDQLESAHRFRTLNWRAWSYWDWRLLRYFEKRNAAAAEKGLPSFARRKSGWFWND